jgi:hypothetical protein
VQTRRRALTDGAPSQRHRGGEGRSWRRRLPVGPGGQGPRLPQPRNRVPRVGRGQRRCGEGRVLARTPRLVEESRHSGEAPPSTLTGESCKNREKARIEKKGGSRRSLPRAELKRGGAQATSVGFGRGRNGDTG